MRPASQEEITLFTLMGQTLLNIQVLEECLSVSITLKADAGHPHKIPIAEANELLKKRRALTLGKAIKEALKRELYEDRLQEALSTFLQERNWLVHKSIDDIYTPTGRPKLFQRIQTIAIEAHRLQRMIEDDLIAFSEGHGMDMSAVKAAIRDFSRKSIE
jgi:hypothetical protein